MNIQPASSNSPVFSAPTPRESKPALAPAEVPSQPSGRSNAATGREPLAKRSVEDALERVSKFVSQTTNDIAFSVDLDSGVDVVKIIDRNTKEVIRQIPSEEMVALAQALDKLQGLFVRDKA